MKKRIVFLLSLILLTIGCDQTKSLDVGRAELRFNGVELELPNNGKSAFAVSPNQLDYQWGDKKLTVRDLGDETLSITTPAVTEQILSKSLIITIDMEGRITTRSATINQQ